MKLITTIALTGAVMAMATTSAWAGPVVIDGTDANEHGSAANGANQDGWLYMQRVLENQAPLVGNGNKVVVTLGTDPSTNSSFGARNAINSAFGLSSLPSLGWSINHVNGESDIASFLSGSPVGGITLAGTGILYIPTAGNSSGDLSALELAQINSRGTAIANFVGGTGASNSGGGLFAMSESPSSGSGVTPYGWLTSVIPGISVNNVSGGSPITLTPAGQTAFPGLTNADLSAGPWHNYFSGNFGSLQVLATSTQGNQTRALILGGGSGTIIDPTPVNPPPTSPQVPFEFSPGLGLLLLGAWGGIAQLKSKVQKRKPLEVGSLTSNNG